LVEELRLLLDALAERAGPWLDRAAAPASCPRCGEVAGRGLDGAADLVAVLRAVLADRWEPGAPHPPGFRPEPAGSSAAQHIPVRREPS
jgi:hypothetical protein